MKAPLSIVATSTLLVACAQDAPKPTWSGPPLPPLHLHDVLGEFEALAKAPAPPPEATQREVRDLADIALRLVEADARLFSRAESALLAHPHAPLALEPALKHKEPGVRARAAWLCARTGQAILQLPLLLALKDEKDPETVVWLAGALLELGNDTGAAWLGAAIDDARTAERAGALAIEALRARKVELPDAPTWDQLRTELARLTSAWRATGEPSLPNAPEPDPRELERRLAAHLITPAGWQLRPVDEARFVLRNLGRRGVPMMARMVVDQRHHLRTMPLKEFANLRQSAHGAADTVLPLLGDVASCADAIRTLGEIGAAQHAPFLRPFLLDPDSELRAAAVKALGVLRDEPSRATFQKLLRDAQETRDVRVGAAFALRCFGDDAEAEAYLADRAQKGDYHASVLAALRERLTTMAR